MGERHGQPVLGPDRQLSGHPRKAVAPSPAGKVRRQSPRGFHVSREPKIQLGRQSRPTRAVQQQPWRNGARDADEEGRIQEFHGAQAMGLADAPVAIDAELTVEQPAERPVILPPAEVRRRRLILDDSEDEAPPTSGRSSPAAAPEGKKGGRRLVKLADALSAAGVPKTREAPRSNRRKRSSVLDRGEKGETSRKKGGAGRTGKKQGGRQGKRAVEKERVQEAEVEENALAEGKKIVIEEAAVPRESDGSQSEEDELRFVIKSRIQPIDKENVGQNGRVKQVVAAFEANLAITEDQTHEDLAEGDMVLKLNEYGSNLDDGTHKRPLQEIEEGLESSPTPKRQFVEEISETVEVEEASHKWPQSDK
ncbi:unnamed protein product [Linum trigynum]|uniref:Uncharacterized protein n=1 Tax=Linum trigynum TaxID=586398 RepID=A0AAV2F8E2_9ROSI